MGNETIIKQEWLTCLPLMSKKAQKIICLIHGKECPPISYSEIGKIFKVSGRRIRDFEFVAARHLHKLFIQTQQIPHIKK